MRELMVFMITSREAGGMVASVVATATARSTTRSVSEDSFCNSLLRSNHQATAKFEITSAAAVTAINCTTRVRGQSFSFMALRRFGLHRENVAASPDRLN